MERWVGKIAVITGASAGIGLALALEFVKRGIITVAVSRRPELVEAAKSDLTEEEADKLHAVKLDITVEEDVMETFVWIRNQFGAVHILVNNAGILSAGTLIDGPSEIFRKTIDVNIYGLSIVTMHAVKLMREVDIEDGHIFHLNSIAGHKIGMGKEFISSSCNVYPATKHAVTALSDLLRKELNSINSPIRVTSISPGIVKTDIFEVNGWDPEGHIFGMPHLVSQDVVDCIIFSLAAPKHVNISEMYVQAVGELV